MNRFIWKILMIKNCSFIFIYIQTLPRKEKLINNSSVYLSKNQMQIFLPIILLLTCRMHEWYLKMIRVVFSSYINAIIRYRNLLYNVLLLLIKVFKWSRGFFWKMATDLYVSLKQMLSSVTPM